MRHKKNLLVNWIKGYDDMAIYKIFFIILLTGIIIQEMTVCATALFLLGQDVSITTVYEMCFGKEYGDDHKKGRVFPFELQCTPRYFKFLFRHAHFDINYIPRIAVWHMYIAAVSAIIFDGAFLGILIWNCGMGGRMRVSLEQALCSLIGLYIITIAPIGIFFGIKAAQITFVCKFKKVTLRNVKYLLWRILFTDPHKKEPSRRVLGKCSVIDVKKRGRKKYADVKMLRDGTIYRNVLIKDEEKKESVKWLQEICKVKYVS